MNSEALHYMITPDNPYFRQVQLLVRVLPFVAEEKSFAIKGGTAINLFLRDLPRLSVDIDLAFLPITDFSTARRQIAEALERIRNRLSARSPAYQVVTGSNDGDGIIDTLNVSSGGVQVKIEVNPVLRGSFEESQIIEIRPAAEQAFGFAEVKALSFNDTYGGKLMAALDRQHPRDLFDVKLLIENEGLSGGAIQGLSGSSGRPQGFYGRRSRSAAQGRSPALRAAVRGHDQRTG